jgi:hypothetical protein
MSLAQRRAGAPAVERGERVARASDDILFRAGHRLSSAVAFGASFAENASIGE